MTTDADHHTVLLPMKSLKDVKSQIWGKNTKERRPVPLKDINTHPKLIWSGTFLLINDTHSGSQRWGPLAAFSGQCADSLYGTKHRIHHTGSTALCLVGGACIETLRMVPLPQLPPPLLRRHHQTMRRSWKRRRQRRWRRTKKRMEKGRKAVEEEGVSWGDLFAYWKEKKKNVWHRLIENHVLKTFKSGKSL